MPRITRALRQEKSADTPAIGAVVMLAFDRAIARKLGANGVGNLPLLQAGVLGKTVIAHQAYVLAL